MSELKKEIEVFISFKNKDLNGNKTKDSDVAQQVYEYLVNKMGLTCFMMNDSLLKKGASYFKKEIDKALEECRVFILVGSEPDYLESDWVRYEWDTFLNEVLSHRKNPYLFTIRLEDLGVSQLPISLRKYQSFEENQLINLYAYIDSINKEIDRSNDESVRSFLYPCIFTMLDDGTYKAYFPDLEIWTDGENLSVAYLSASALLHYFFVYRLHTESDFNKPSKYENLISTIKDGEILMYVYCQVFGKEIRTGKQNKKNW